MAFQGLDAFAADTFASWTWRGISRVPVTTVGAVAISASERYDLTVTAQSRYTLTVSHQARYTLTTSAIGDPNG